MAGRSMGWHRGSIACCDQLATPSAETGGTASTATIRCKVYAADLAMMKLFDSPGARFFACYREWFPIDAGYAERSDLYNLCHLLNYANLFGGGYTSQAQRSIDCMLAQPG